MLRRWSVVHCAVAALACACGSVGDPRPPLANLPEPISDLSARQFGDSLVISWTRPLRTTEGLAAKETGFTLWAVEVGAVDTALADETIDAYRRAVERIEPVELDSVAPGNRLEIRSPLDAWTLGQPAILVVTAWNRLGRDAGYSNHVPIQPLQPPEPPLLYPPSVTEDGVALGWRPSTRAEEYSIDRATDADAEFNTLDRLSAVEYLDRTARPGVTYRYRLRPWRMSDAGRVEGLPSETVSVTPRDVFPPSPPAGLRAVRTATAVELSWLPGEEPDLAGYRVLRGGAALTPVIAETSYSDATAIPGTPYEYEVMAVDTEGNESGTGPSIRVPARESDFE